MNSIEVLMPSLLSEYKDRLKTIDHWLSVLNWSNGWHYDLDLLWLFKHIDRIKLKKGATIIDAGGGLGVNQFILASMGYNVISLDFTYRNVPKLAKNIFKIRSDQDRFLEQKLREQKKSEYMDFMGYGQKKSQSSTLSNAEKLLKALKNPAKAQYVFKRELLQNYLNLSQFLEARRDHKNFGEITFLRGTFNEIPLPDQSADLLVSVSAFEHNAYEDMPGSVQEFSRVTKKGGYLLVTTSLAKDKDWYFEPSKGWNLSTASLSKWFGVENPKSFDFDKSLKEISTSKALEKRISPFYKYNGNNGLPYAKLQEAKYVPCGIVKQIL